MVSFVGFECVVVGDDLVWWMVDQGQCVVQVGEVLLQLVVDGGVILLCQYVVGQVQGVGGCDVGFVELVLVLLGQLDFGGEIQGYVV